MENNTRTFNVLMANLENFHNTFLRSDIKKLADQIDQANSEGQIDCLVIWQTMVMDMDKIYKIWEKSETRDGYDLKEKEARLLAIEGCINIANRYQSVLENCLSK